VRALPSKPIQAETNPEQATVDPARELATRRPHRPWTGFNVLLPSITDFIFLLLFAGLTIGGLAPKLLGDAGIGWHIRAGELMLRSHTVLRTDVFSSTMGGRPWYAWEWLYDGAIAAVHHFTGLNGVVLVTALLVSITFAWVFRLSLNRGSGMLVTLILLVLSVFASSIHFFARPHVLSWLMAVVWFDIIDRSESSAEKRRQLWLLVPLTPLWVNVHGGFLLGFALLAIYLAAAAIRFFRSKDIEERSKTRTWLNQLSKATLLSALATLANPYGYHLHVHIYRYLSDRFLMNHIDEFHSPNFHGLAQQCFAAMLLITLLAMASVRGRLRTSHLLVVVFSAYSGLYASRNLPTSCILLMLVIGPILSKAITDLGNDTSVANPLRRWAELNAFDTRMRNMEFRFRGHLWPVVMVILGLAVCIHGGRIGSRQLMQAHFDGKRFPVQAVDITIPQPGSPGGPQQPKPGPAEKQ